MQTQEKLKQINGAWDRVVEANILLDNVARNAADNTALDLAAELDSINRKIGDYLARQKRG